VQGFISSKIQSGCFQMCKLRQGITFLPHRIYTSEVQMLQSMMRALSSKLAYCISPINYYY